MCITAGTAALALSAAGTAANTIGTLGKASAQSNAAAAQAQIAAYQGQVAQNNAAIANQEASTAIAVGQGQAANQSMQGAANSGALKVSQAANGVDVNTGTAVNVQAGQRQINQLANQTVLNNAQRGAYGYRVQAAQDTAQSQLDTASQGLYQGEAQNAAIGGLLGGAGTLLGGASQLPFGWSGNNTPAANPLGGGNGEAGLGAGSFGTDAGATLF